MAASDAFAVKPADLPSMRGVDAPMPEVHVVNATGMSDAAAFDAVKAGKARAVAVEVPASEASPALEGWGIAAGFGGPAGSFAQIGSFKLDAAGNPLPIPPSKPRAPRPRLKVTNWWTGEYRLESDSVCRQCGYDLRGLANADRCPECGTSTQGSADSQTNARLFRKHAYEFKQQAEHLRRQAGTGSMSARRAAREQIKAARQRAREIPPRPDTPTSRRASAADFGLGDRHRRALSGLSRLHPRRRVPETCLIGCGAILRVRQPDSGPPTGVAGR
jgi:hypothetical protein